jgi:aldehyde dehydrogenase (NAD+)
MSSFWSRDDVAQTPAIWGAGGARAGSGSPLDVYDPSTGEVINHLIAAGASDLDTVVDEALAAFAGPWSTWTPAERGAALHRVAALITERSNQLRDLVILDAGLPSRMASGDVLAATRYFEFYAGLAGKLHGDSIPLGPGFVDYTVREPWGVCGVVLPFNVPLQMAARSIAAALVSGNVVVLKPAEQAPFAALALAQLCRDAGIPQGVVTAVVGTGADIGDPLVRHSGIDHVTFTGSLATGKNIMRAAADGMKPVLLELGGKSPQIVFDDADLEAAIPSIVGSALRTAGQACSAGTRILVQRSGYDEAIARLGEASAALSLGAAGDDPDVGPVISERQRSIIEAAILASIESGAERVGERNGDVPPGGYYVAPTVLAASGPHVTSAREEIFGPVLTVLPFNDEDDAVNQANDSEFGLVAGVWTNHIGRAHRMAARVKAGQVFINNYGVGGGVELPFGGYKRSGFGRLKGVAGALEYTQLKNVCVAIS